MTSGSSSPSPSVPSETTEPTTPAALAGMELAYAVRSATGSTIHIMAADGTNDRPLTPGSSPAWSLFADSLAYGCGEPSADSIGDVCHIGADGGNQSVLISDAINPRWSPNGTYLMFSRSPFDLTVGPADQVVTVEYAFPP